MSRRAQPPPSGPATFLTAERRTADLEALAGGAEVDVLVVGAGFTGAGVALDAITRGLSVALVDRGDLATGTSRWSSKLAHGGLRYLAKLQFDVAWESARERATLTNATAPHMASALPMLTPVYGRFPPPAAFGLEAGIRMGDAMRALSGTSRRRLPGARRIAGEEARLWAPAVKVDELRGAILAWDAQLEDDARLVVALARTAAGHGARVCTYSEVTRLTEAGAQVRDVTDGSEFELRARHVVNATGVWADQLVDGIRLRPSKGAHLLVPAERLANPRATINVAVPGHFGRFVFAVPRSDGLVLIGLTDDAFNGEIPDAPPVSAEDERFLLETVSLALRDPLGPEDVVGRYAGLRPLLDRGSGATADLSRRHAVIEDPASGAITVVGGKLTTYRRMAEDAVDVIAARPGVGAGRCRTTRLPVVGAPPRGFRAPARIPERLWRRFGTEALELVESAEGRPQLLEPIAPGLPALAIEIVAAIEREGALGPDDVLDRRTRLGLVPAWREAAAAAVEHGFERVEKLAA
ncbi:glycerol-3-phosphate dehydrogenase/oxidase [Thermoleophilia bacterium SCSIO 60948]|nr:glycerol-3-phosphate dehydrogenase/oxidase [Thermoleophilia bacterium SCSIO 60948]